jgi:hypothetical protein
MRRRMYSSFSERVDVRMLLEGEKEKQVLG